MAEQKLPKLTTRVRFPSPAPFPPKSLSSRLVIAAVLLSGCVASEVAEPYPWEGVWDCGELAGVFTLTDTIYNPGEEEIEILEISEEGAGHVLRMVDGYEVHLTIAPDDTMHWLSLHGYDDLTCRRLR